ncbi:hypothetical protein Dsin_000864 [Dipteronia sinensis]|uniref:Uncharacterized protein n=1 Tax=Dipteronia sinensis TaxID=43782 RepID=A0AAE0EHU0_9ROSI|nr:hypothetical protein Dsin_000864 [Dipteronia sinensis]
MLHMDILGDRRVRHRYKKLTCDEAAARPKSRRCWVKKMNGGLRGLRLSRSRKLTLKATLPGVMVLRASKIVRIMYGDILERIMNVDGLCPNIIFTTQWGLPVLAHPSLKSKRNS